MSNYKRWDENTSFRAVIVRADNPSVVHQRLAARDTVDEVLRDIQCFFHRCKCTQIPPKPRKDGHACLRYTKVEPKTEPVIEYIDNDEGFRSLAYKYKVKDDEDE